MIDRNAEQARRAHHDHPRASSADFHDSVLSRTSTWLRQRSERRNAPFTVSTSSHPSSCVRSEQTASCVPLRTRKPSPRSTGSPEQFSLRSVGTIASIVSVGSVVKQDARRFKESRWTRGRESQDHPHQHRLGDCGRPSRWWPLLLGERGVSADTENMKPIINAALGKGSGKRAFFKIVAGFANRLLTALSQRF